MTVTPEWKRNNFLNFISRAGKDFNEAYEFSKCIERMKDKKDSNAMQYVMEDIHRKALKGQEFNFQALLKLIDEYHLNESKKWENISV